MEWIVTGTSTCTLLRPRTTFTGTVTGFRPSTAARPGLFAVVLPDVVTVVADDGDESGEAVLDEAAVAEAVVDEATPTLEELPAELVEAAELRATDDDCGPDVAVEDDAGDGETATAVPPVLEHPVTASAKTATPIPHCRTALDRASMT